MALYNYIYLKKVSLSACLFLCCFFFPWPLFSNDGRWEFNQDEQQAYHLIISLQLDKASRLLTTERPASAYLDNLKESIKLIITEDPELAEDYEDHLDKRFNLIESNQEDTPYKKFYLAELYLQRAFVNLKFGNEWSAAWDFRRAYKLITENIGLFPDFLPHYKSMGLLHVMIGSVPERYQWALGLLGLEGSVSKGLGELKKIAESNHLFNIEAHVIKYLLDAYLFNKSNLAANNFKNIFEAHPHNKLFGYLYMSLLIKNAQSANALAVYNHLQTLEKDYMAFNFLHYVAGELYLQKGAYDMAEDRFVTFLDNARGRNFIKDAYYKLFLVYWLKGHKAKAIQAHKAAQSSGQAQVEADKHAAKSLSQPQFPNKLIMKIRLSTDGGFYEQAMDLIALNPTFHTKKEKVEFTYRKARLFHKTDNIDDAIQCYRETIDASVGQNWYFAPNAALQLGYIFHEKEDFSRAKYYFSAVAAYKGHEYKASLDNKAKVALAAYEQ